MNVVVMEVREDDEDAETKIVGAASPTMTRCTINDNTAANSGEMLAVDLVMVARGGRAQYWRDSTLWTIELLFR
jgi:hypothetical protein